MTTKSLFLEESMIMENSSDVNNVIVSLEERTCLKDTLQLYMLMEVIYSHVTCVMKHLTGKTAEKGI